MDARTSQRVVAKQPWLVGGNFTPSTAINQLEMWQAETWDPKTIDRELGWAHELGFTSMRVFLHDIVWKQNPKAFLNRMDEFLDIADKHDIGVMFVYSMAFGIRFQKRANNANRVRTFTTPAGCKIRVRKFWAIPRVTMK